MAARAVEDSSGTSLSAASASLRMAAFASGVAAWCATARARRPCLESALCAASNAAFAAAVSPEDEGINVKKPG